MADAIYSEHNQNDTTDDPVSLLLGQKVVVHGEIASIGSGRNAGSQELERKCVLELCALVSQMAQDLDVVLLLESESVAVLEYRLNALARVQRVLLPLLLQLAQHLRHRLQGAIQTSIGRSQRLDISSY